MDDLEPIRNLSHPWRCESCGYEGIVNLRDTASTFAIYAAMRQAHDELSPCRDADISSR